jgi:hypothetical protein
MKRPNAEQIRALLEQNGFESHPGIQPPRPGHTFKAPKDLPLPSHTIWAKRLGAVWWGAVSLPEDREKLSALARESGECFYVFSGATPSTRPFPHVADRFLWWTRVGTSESDLIVPIKDYNPGRFELPKKNYRYAIGTIEGQKFFNWENLLLVGEPPKGAATYETDFDSAMPLGDKLRMKTKPLFFHRSGPLELIWFLNGFPVWKKEYDLVTRAFPQVQFRKPAGLGLVMGEAGDRPVALLLRAKFGAREARDTAWRQFETLFSRRK